MTEMKRGPGGRLEDAFAAAKERGEAAFVGFITAGFPAAEGKLHIQVQEKKEEQF